MKSSRVECVPQTRMIHQYEPGIMKLYITVGL